MKKLILMSVLTSLFYASGAMAATVSFLNDGTNGTSSTWTTNIHDQSYDPSGGGFLPQQTGAISGEYIAHGAVNDVWQVTVAGGPATVSFSIDYTLSNFSTAVNSGIPDLSAKLYTAAGTSLGTLLASTLTPTSITTYADTIGVFESADFSPLLLNTGTYYMVVAGYSTSNASSKGSYDIDTPSTDSLAVPEPSSIALMGMVLGGLTVLRRKKS